MSSKRELSKLAGKPSTSELFTLGIPREFHTPILGMYEGGEAKRFNAITDLAEKYLELKPHNAALEYLASRALHDEQPQTRLEAVRSLADLAARHPEALTVLSRLKVELKKQGARYKEHLFDEINAVRERREPPTVERPNDLTPREKGAHDSTAIASYAREALGNPHERIRQAALERLERALEHNRGEALKGILGLKSGLERHAPKDATAAKELFSVKRLLESAGAEQEPAEETPGEIKAVWVPKHGEQGKEEPLTGGTAPSKTVRKARAPVEESFFAFNGSVKEKIDAIDAAAREGSNEHLPALFHALSNESGSVRSRVIRRLIHWRSPEIERLLTAAEFKAGETPHGDVLRYIKRKRRR